MGYFVNERASDNIRQSLREDFFRETLPELALQMQKLNISVEEVKNVLQTLQAKE
jgi:DNA-binding transcriptional regulator YhcF (GntR family)